MDGPGRSLSPHLAARQWPHSMVAAERFIHYPANSYTCCATNWNTALWSVNNSAGVCHACSPGDISKMKRKLWLILIPVLVTVICGTLSFLAGHYVPWTPLGTPPEPAVEIASANSRAVYVHTAGSKTYRCVHGPRGTYALSRDCGWEEINLADFGPGVPEKVERCSYLLPPGRVADRFYFCSGPHWRYLVLTDGSVWALHDDGDFTVDDVPSIYIGLAFRFLGPIVSLLLGFATFHFLWRRRHHQV